MGKLDIQRSSTQVATVICDALSGGNVLDTTTVRVTSNAYQNASFLTSLEAPGATSVTLACRTTSSNVTVQNRSLSAVQVQTLTIQ